LIEQFGHESGDCSNVGEMKKSGQRLPAQSGYFPQAPLNRYPELLGLVCPGKVKVLRQPEAARFNGHIRLEFLAKQFRS
jgi:hypothetical protein